MWQGRVKISFFRFSNWLFSKATGFESSINVSIENKYQRVTFARQNSPWFFEKELSSAMELANKACVIQLELIKNRRQSPIF